MTITIRKFSPNDIPQLVTLRAAIEQVDHRGLATEEDEVREILAHASLGAEDNLFVAEADGQIVGSALTGIRRGIGETVFFLTGGVHPAWRRQRVGTRLLQATMARARERRTEAGDGAIWYQSDDIPDENPGWVGLFEANGFHVARWELDMRRELPGVGEPAPIVPLVEEPDGIQLRKWRPGIDDEPVGNLFNEAFRDHWGYWEIDMQEWLQVITRGRISVEHSVLAWDTAGERLVGACANMCDEQLFERRGRPELYIEVLGVLREYRRRGVATALLTWTLNRASHLGMQSVGLDADAENTSNAVRLYTRLGFRPIGKMRIYRKAME